MGVLFLVVRLDLVVRGFPARLSLPVIVIKGGPLRADVVLYTSLWHLHLRITYES